MKHIQTGINQFPHWCCQSMLWPVRQIIRGHNCCTSYPGKTAGGVDRNKSPHAVPDKKDIISVYVISYCILFIVSPLSHTNSIIDGPGKRIIPLTSPVSSIGKTDDYQSGATQVLCYIKSGCKPGKSMTEYYTRIHLFLFSTWYQGCPIHLISVNGKDQRFQRCRPFLLTIQRIFYYLVNYQCHNFKLLKLSHLSSESIG